MKINSCHIFSITRSFIVPLFIALATLNNTYAQGIGAGTFAYPSAGQSQEQTQKDTIECHNWSVAQTGFDPTRNYAPPPSYTTAPPPGSSGYFGSGETGQGGVVRDAAGKGKFIRVIQSDEGNKNVFEVEITVP